MPNDDLDHMKDDVGSSPTYGGFYVWVAQIAEQWTENPRVIGAIPILNTTRETAKRWYLGGRCWYEGFILAHGKEISFAKLGTGVRNCADDNVDYCVDIILVLGFSFLNIGATW